MNLCPENHQKLLLSFPWDISCFSCYFLKEHLVRLIFLNFQSLSQRVLAEMTKHTFPAHSFREQKRYLCRHLIRLRSVKLRSFISRFQELNPCLAEFSPDTEGQETEPLPADEIMDIIYHVERHKLNRFYCERND